MERKDSQIKDYKYEIAIEKGLARKCIGNKCICWTYCSHNNTTKVPMCTSDLETQFYKYSKTYTVAKEDTVREKSKTPKSKVFDRDYQRRKRRLRERETL